MSADYLIEDEEERVRNDNRSILLKEAAKIIVVEGLEREVAIRIVEKRYAEEQDAEDSGLAIIDDLLGEIDYPTLPSQPRIELTRHQERQVYKIHLELCDREGIDPH